MLIKEYKGMKKYTELLMLTVISLMAMCSLSSCIYINTYYHASDEAWASINEPQSGVKVSQTDDYIMFEPESGTSDYFIYYPGAKVEYEAYAPVAEQLALAGVACALVKAPLRLTILDSTLAEDVIAQNPDVENWFIGGHSMGGLSASDYAYKNQEKFKGLVFIASRTNKDIRDISIPVLSIIGDCDGVCTKEKYEGSAVNLPDTRTEVLISGANHGQFGWYGFQSGDNQAGVTHQEQTRQTVEAICSFIERWSK